MYYCLFGTHIEVFVCLSLIPSFLHIVVTPVLKNNPSDLSSLVSTLNYYIHFFLKFGLLKACILLVLANPLVNHRLQGA